MAHGRRFAGERCFGEGRQIWDMLPETGQAGRLQVGQRGAFKQPARRPAAEQHAIRNVPTRDLRHAFDLPRRTPRLDHGSAVGHDGNDYDIRSPEGKDAGLMQPATGVAKYDIEF